MYHPKWLKYILALALSFIALLLYWHILSYPFQFDSVLIVLKNPKILKFEWPGFYKLFFEPVQNWPGRRWVLYWSLAINYRMGGYDVTWYKLTNIILHSINVSLLFFLFYLTASGTRHETGEKKSGSFLSFKDAIWLSFLCALFFAVHPIQTESVIYINARSELLVSMFFMAGLIFYRFYEFARNRLVSYILCISVISCYLLALLSKEYSVTFPALLLLYDYCFLCNTNGTVMWEKWRKRLLPTLVLVVFTVLYGLVLLFKTEKEIGYGLKLESVTSYTYFLTQLQVILYYFKLLFLPLEQNLDYDFTLVTSFLSLRCILSFMALASLLVIAAKARRKYPSLFFGVFFFFIVLFPTSSFFPIDDLIFEHRLYLPSVGFFLILSLCIKEIPVIWNKYFHHRISTMLLFSVVIYVMFLAYKTVDRSLVWKDELTLWHDVVKKSPLKPRGHIYVGIILLKRGAIDEAISSFSKAAELSPDNPRAYANLGLAYAQKKEYQKAMAMFQKAMVLEPYFPELYCNMANFYIMQGDLDKALVMAQKALSQNPDIKEIPLIFQDVYQRLGHYWLSKDNLPNALAFLRKAVELDPNDAQTWTDIGSILMTLGKMGDAFNALRTALKLQPGYAQAHLNIGVYYYKTGQFLMARQEFEAYLTIDPEAPDAEKVKKWIEQLKN